MYIVRYVDACDMLVRGMVSLKHELVVCGMVRDRIVNRFHWFFGKTSHMHGPQKSLCLNPYRLMLTVREFLVIAPSSKFMCAYCCFVAVLYRVHACV